VELVADIFYLALPVVMWDNNFMTENRPARAKNENMKTESALGGKFAELEFGKPVKLPFIRKISSNAQQPTIPRRSL
jgi:hypothetical protein